MPRRRAAAPVVEEVEEIDELEELDDPEVDEEDDDLEELEEEPPPATAKKTARKAAKAAPAKSAPRRAAPAPAAESSEFDSNWLAAHVTEETGITYDSRAIRMLLRKLAKDGSLAREVGTDRSRYVFPKGANDATVKAVIRMVRSGEAKNVQQAGLETARASKAAKSAPAKAPAKKAAPAKATTRRRRAAE